MFSINKKISISEIINEGNIYELFLTHDFDGGTRIFERNYLKNKNNIIILRNISYRKDLLFSVENPQSLKRKYYKPKEIKFIFALDCFSIVTVNSFVKNISFNVIIDFLEKMKRRINHKIFIQYFIHDYQCLCPNYTLVYKNKYCGLLCNKNSCKFDRLFVKKSMTIDNWRNIWGRFFFCVSEIRCFSQSSKEIIAGVYKDIFDKIVIMPHDLSYCHFEPIRTIGLPFRIGIIGNLTAQVKGIDIVKIFLKYASSKKVFVSIIGKINLRDKVLSKFINYCGSYNVESLQKIIEEEKITNVLFPSIGPETFSYLLSELIQMDIPIVCFGIGAQADKIKNYSKGLICRTNNPDDILETMMESYSKYN
jgi:glycosyltransferase involved in cell wall biosynthesis